MEHQLNGVTIWYGDDNTPAPVGEVRSNNPVSLIVGVRPANLTNSIDVEYTINGGPQRIAPSTMMLDRSAANEQFFRVVFPYLPPGSRVAYAPVLRSMGRRIDGGLADIDRPSFFIQREVPLQDRQAGPSRESRDSLRTSFEYTLELLGQVRASLAPALIIGETPDGLRVNFSITGGEIVGKRFNAKVESGGADDLRIREDGTAILAVRTTLKADDGSRIYTEYSGVLDLGPDGYQRAVRGDFPPKPRVHLAPRYVTASPTYNWLNRLQCMGIGYVTMAKLEVNYDLYVMHIAGGESAT